MVSDRMFIAFAAPAVALLLAFCWLGAFADRAWFVGTVPLVAVIPYLFAAYYAQSWRWWRRDLVAARRADATAAALDEAEARGRDTVARWGLLLADEFEGLAGTSDLVAEEFAKTGDPIIAQWHRGLAQARRTSAARIRAAVAPAVASDS